MLLEEFNLEIACGLGDYADRMWRIGIMGHSAQQANVMLLPGWRSSKPCSARATHPRLRRRGSRRTVYSSA